MKCGAKNKAGKPCGAPALGGSKPPRCAAHATGKAAQRVAEARREGGRQRMRQVDRRPPEEPRPAPKTKEDVVAELWRIHQQVSSGAISARDGNLMVLSLRAMLETDVLADPAPAQDSGTILIVRRRRITAEQAAE